MPGDGARLTILAMPRLRAGRKARARHAGEEDTSHAKAFPPRRLPGDAGFAVAAPAVFRVTQVRAAEFCLKYANNLPVTHPLNDARTVEAMDAIRKETNGRVEIQVFPNNQLGGDTDMLAQVRSRRASSSSRCRR